MDYLDYLMMMKETYLDQTEGWLWTGATHWMILMKSTFMTVFACTKQLQQT